MLRFRFLRFGITPACRMELLPAPLGPYRMVKRDAYRLAVIVWISAERPWKKSLSPSSYARNPTYGQKSSVARFSTAWRRDLRPRSHAHFSLIRALMVACRGDMRNPQRPGYRSRPSAHSTGTAPPCWASTDRKSTRLNSSHLGISY